MESHLLDALNAIPVSSTDYGEWLQIGMALHKEGYPVGIWESWSAGDSRFKDGECERKWRGFHDKDDGVKAGTLVDIAKKYGYNPKREVVVFDWDDEIQYDGDQDTVVKDVGWLNTEAVSIPTDEAFNQTDQLRRYLQALFKEDDIVGYCVDSTEDEKGKWRPASKGAYGMTAGQLLKGIKKHPDNIKDVIGDYNEEAGAWIRFNPLDGQGVSNENVTDLRYALVESDNMEIEKQKAIMEELKLPIAVMVHSGGKSIHAIVKVDAVNMQDYREKVDYLYRVCEKNGLTIDKQNKNPSRMSRMPGVYRNDKKQFIIADNLGCATFEEWKEHIESSIDTLPDIISFGDLESLPELAPELIHGILRKGHKMLIAGPSKAGKSFLLIELALCIASGKTWLGFDCDKCNVLYINLEVDGPSFLHRVEDVRSEMGIETKKGLDIWNLRGENAAINNLAPRLIRRAKGKNYDAIIFDPLYKINQGDENSASEMGKFFNQLDYICSQLKTSIICCHHHSKGAQGGKFSIDRASGSGVFARDPDAILDMIQINPNDVEYSMDEGTTAWRISFTLREFRSPDDIDVIFDHPVHRVTEDLKEAQPMSGMGAATNSKRGNSVKSGKAEDKYVRLQTFVENWDEIDTSVTHLKYPSLKDAEKYFKDDKGFGVRTMRRWIEQHDDYTVNNGIIFPKNRDKTDE